MTVLELLWLMFENPHVCFEFPLLGRRNVWAVLRIGKKYTKRKEYESTEELAVEMFLEFDT